MNSSTLKPLVHQTVTTAIIGMTQWGFLNTGTGLPVTASISGCRMPNWKSSIHAQIIVTTDTGKT